MDPVKKKPALSLVIGMGKAKEPKEDDEASEGGGEFDVAAEELFEAIKGDDVEAFKEALRAVKSC